MGMVGADVDQLRMLSRTLGHAADLLEGMSGTVSSMLAGTTWAGPDAERNRSQWHGASVAQVRAVVTALREAANTLNRNADEQLTASARAVALRRRGPGALTPAQVASPETLRPIRTWSTRLADIRDFLNSNAVWPITWDVAGPGGQVRRAAATGRARVGQRQPLDRSAADSGGAELADRSGRVY